MSSLHDTHEPDRSWPKVSADLQLEAVTAVAADRRGKIWIVHRGKPPVICFDREGNLVSAWGDEYIEEGGGHGLRIDSEGFVWITGIKHHQVYQFSDTGELVLSLGTRGVPGDTSESFNQPTDVAVSSSRNIYVSDGYGNDRIVMFDPQGRFIHSWGGKGREPGRFDLPHSLCFDSKGTLYVSDRSNSRVQLFTEDGTFVSEWRGFPYFDCLYCAPDNTLYGATGRSNVILRLSTTDFEANTPNSLPIVLDQWSGKYSTKQELEAGYVPPYGDFNVAHGVGLDSNGDIYVAEVRAGRVQRLSKLR